MKKMLLFAVTLFASLPAFAQQDDTYIPLVEEGKEWCYIRNYSYQTYLDHLDDPGISNNDRCYLQYYYIKGDTVLNGVSYKKLYARNYEWSDFYTPASGREQPKRALTYDDPYLKTQLYAFIRETPDRKVYYIDYYWSDTIITCAFEFFSSGIRGEYYEQNRECLLFDFNNMDTLFKQRYYAYTHDSIETAVIVPEEPTQLVGMRHPRKVYKLIKASGNTHSPFHPDVIEGIGFLIYHNTGNFVSDAYPYFVVCGGYDCLYYVRHGDGEYEFLLDGIEVSSSIDDVSIDRAGLTDENYYDLTGRVVRNPSPGIYIHKGKKVIIR